MNELLVVKNNNIELYEKLILEKDELLRKCNSYQIEYLRLFGEKMREKFLIKVECIKKKKEIAYCERLLASGKKTISQSELDTYIKEQMKEYEEILIELLNDIDSSKRSKKVSSYELLKIKKIYRKIVKMIHPDVNAAFNNDDNLKELFNRATRAYHNSHLKDLEEIEDLVNIYLKEHDINNDVFIEDIINKINDLEEKIVKIKSEDPYQYKYIFDDPSLIESEKQDYDKDISEYKDYLEQLNAVLNKYNIERSYS